LYTLSVNTPTRIGPMIDTEQLAQSVQENCHISDAKYAGNYSLCVFLLKMREYYRWEHNIPLSQPLTKAEVGNWISQRELQWSDYENSDLKPLVIADQTHDPFDDAKINTLLNPLGYVYSGGLGIFGKPSFFLAELEQHKEIDDLHIYITTRELARDLVSPPAMIIDNRIYIRKESLRRYIWEKIEEWRWKSDTNTPMARALAHYQAHHDSMEQVLTAMCDNESQSAILHELGEAKANLLLGTEWKDILYNLPHSSMELKLRAIKDHIADTISTLPGLLETENIPALHFYFANLTGMRKEIFPEAVLAYSKWIDTSNLRFLEMLCIQGKTKFLDIASQIKQVYQCDHSLLQKNLESIVNF